MDTTRALKKAMDAVKDAGIPEELWATALPLALADLRGSGGASAGDGPTSPPADPSSTKAEPKTSTSTSTRRATKKASGSASGSSAGSSVLVGLSDEADLFKKVAAETEVSVDALADVFYVEGGELHLKVRGKDLGDSKRAATSNVAALLSGVVFSGTSHTKVPFKDINSVCKAKHVHDSRNSATYIKSTPGFARWAPEVTRL